MLDSSRLIVKEYIDDLKNPGGYMSDDDENDDEKDDETDDETGEVNPNLIYKDDETKDNETKDNETKDDETKDDEGSTDELIDMDDLKDKEV